MREPGDPLPLWADGVDDLLLLDKEPAYHAYGYRQGEMRRIDFFKHNGDAWTSMRETIGRKLGR